MAYQTDLVRLFNFIGLVDGDGLILENPFLIDGTNSNRSKVDNQHQKNDSVEPRRGWDLRRGRAAYSLRKSGIVWLSTLIFEQTSRSPQTRGRAPYF